MMKKEMLFAVLAIGYIVNAGLIIAKEQLITLPTKEVIAKRLRENGYTYFDEKMKLAENFGDQEKYVTGFVMHLELAILDFCEKNEKICRTAQMSRDGMLRTILQDNPEAINELEELKLIEKRNTRPV